MKQYSINDPAAQPSTQNENLRQIPVLIERLKHPCTRKSKSKSIKDRFLHWIWLSARCCHIERDANPFIPESHWQRGRVTFTQRNMIHKSREKQLQKTYSTSSVCGTLRLLEYNLTMATTYRIFCPIDLLCQNFDWHYVYTLTNSRRLTGIRMQPNHNQ